MRWISRSSWGPASTSTHAHAHAHTLPYHTMLLTTQTGLLFFTSRCDKSSDVEIVYMRLEYFHQAFPCFPWLVLPCLTSSWLKTDVQRRWHQCSPLELRHPSAFLDSTSSKSLTSPVNVSSICFLAVDAPVWGRFIPIPKSYCDPNPNPFTLVLPINWCR